MTAVFRAGVTATGGSSSAAATIPSAIVAGDLMLLVVSFKASFPGASINTPSGWSVVTGPVNMTGAVGQGAVYSRVSDGTDGGTTLTVTGTGATQQLDYAMAGWAGSNGIIRASGFTDQGVTASTSIACASQTSVAGDLIALVAATRGSVNGAYTFTAPGGYAVEEQVSSAAAAQDVGAVICDGATTGSQTITASIAVWAIAGQVVIEAAYIPAAPGRRRIPSVPPRRRTAQAPPPAASAPPVDQPGRARSRALPRPRRRSAQPVPTPAPVPAAPRHQRPPTVRRPAGGARSPLLPPLALVAPPYPPQAVRPHRVLPLYPSRRRPSSPWVTALESCIVVRPFTGLAVRPDTGTVTRPNTGIVVRPGCH